MAPAALPTPTSEECASWGPVGLTSWPFDAELARVQAGDVVLNVLSLRSEETFDLRAHPGIHPELLRATYRHPDFPEVLRVLLASLADAHSRGGWWGQLEVALVCRQGRHRSVAAAELLADRLRRLGVSRVSVRHSEDGRSWPRLCADGRCPECGPRWGPLEGPTHSYEA